MASAQSHRPTEWEPRVSKLEEAVANIADQVGRLGPEMDSKFSELDAKLEARKTPLSTIITIFIGAATALAGMMAALLGAFMLPAHLQHTNLRENFLSTIGRVEERIGKLDERSDANSNDVTEIRSEFRGLFEETEGQFAAANSMNAGLWAHQQRLNGLLFRKTFNEELPPLQDGLILAPTRRAR